MQATNLAYEKVNLGTAECIWLANQYHAEDEIVLIAANELSPEHFLRLFITAHGMTPTGIWQTHTYARYTDSVSGKDHFFLIPMSQNKHEKRPNIRFENGLLMIDHIQTAIYPQSIPHTTPFWYFHYDPNKEHQPYDSMTLNLSPACLEKCVLCAGAKTGRVNNGMDSTLSAETVVTRIFEQHQEAIKQLNSVAVVTGCFPSFNQLKQHLTDVRRNIDAYCKPSTYRVLEHNIVTEEQFDDIVGKLGYDIFVTLECYDQNLRNIALNGKVGHKGRDSKKFVELIKTYANYLDARPELGKHLVRVTYLMGLDSLDVTEYFFQQLAEINQSLKHTQIVPWLSIFTAYNDAMRTIQNKDFNLRFLLDGMKLTKKYFKPELLVNESGTTSDGYARGFF
jgi:hypothetical protein